MTDLLTPPTPEPPRADRRKLIVAAAATTLVVLALGAALFARRWVRRGGPRRLVTELAEEGAVKLADAVIDEVLPAAS